MNGCEISHDGLQKIKKITIKVKSGTVFELHHFSYNVYWIGLPTQSKRATPESSVVILKGLSFPVPKTVE